ADAFNHQRLFPYHQRCAFGPAAVDVGQGQGVDVVATLLAATAVFDHIAFAVSRRWFTPVGKGPHRHALLDGRTHAPTSPPRSPACFPNWAQQPVDGSRTDIQ